ncbi:MAG: lipoyl synthase [Candidatus Bipolaricaulia bacterium]
MRHKPDWVKASAPGTESREKLGRKLDELGIDTVCREADCPNQGECWSDGTATFMIMGNVCTRNCSFCDVKTGHPGGTIDEKEPGRLKEAVKRLDLDYVVLTSVDRDDLPDGGAEHFLATVDALKEISDPPLVEGLIPDFKGKVDALERVARGGLDVVGHNIETVRRLTPKVRDARAGYELTLSVLEKMKEVDPDLVTKSSIMAGLGEELEEIERTLEDLYRVGVDIVTIGQYLRPTEDQLPVERFWDSTAFEELEDTAEEMGFKNVIAGPFVRSSYKAKEVYLETREFET